jgi:hypothetical protein
MSDEKVLIWKRKEKVLKVSISHTRCETKEKEAIAKILVLKKHISSITT